MPDAEFVTVYRSQGMLQAQVVKGRLESEGVPVFLRYEPVGQVLGLIVDGLGLVEVQVPQEWAADAEAILSEPVEGYDESEEGPEDDLAAPGRA